MNHDHSNSNNTTHLLIMLACCLVPLALILAIGVFGISLGSLTPLLPYAMILLCPLLMFFMMRSMGHEHGAAEMHQAKPTHAISKTPARPSSEAVANSESGRTQCH